MWMAIVLICEGGIKEQGYCFTSMAEFTYSTIDECQDNILYAYDLGLFNYPAITEGGQEWVPTDFLCYNWLEEKGDV
jgi:hypothetical protein